MTIQDWGALGELGGAIAVVITLVYLARQIGQSNLATTISSEQHRLDAAQNLLLLIVHSAPLTEAMRTAKGFAPQLDRAAAALRSQFPLDENQAFLLTTYWTAFFAMWEEYYSNPLKDERPSVNRRHDLRAFLPAPFRIDGDE